jgi:hypothetical protein
MKGILRYIPSLKPATDGKRSVAGFIAGGRQQYIVRLVRKLPSTHKLTGHDKPHKIGQAEVVEQADAPDSKL